MRDRVEAADEGGDEEVLVEADAADDLLDQSSEVADAAAKLAIAAAKLATETTEALAEAEDEDSGDDD